MFYRWTNYLSLWTLSIINIAITLPVSNCKSVLNRTKFGDMSTETGIRKLKHSEFEIIALTIKYIETVPRLYPHHA